MKINDDSRDLRTNHASLFRSAFRKVAPLEKTSTSSESREVTRGYLFSRTIISYGLLRVVVSIPGIRQSFTGETFVSKQIMKSAPRQVIRYFRKFFFASASRTYETRLFVSFFLTRRHFTFLLS